MKSIYKTMFILLLMSINLILTTSCGKRISCCLIKLPPVTFTSERTSLENQILGTYQEIKEDAWIISSSQSVEGLRISATTNTNMQQDINNKYYIIKAVETIEYNKEISLKYKKKGYIGENNKGMLSYIKNNYIENNPKEKEKLFLLIEEINDSRRVLMIEVINKDEELIFDDMDKVQKTFADMHQNQMDKGGWIQNNEDEWKRK